MKRDWTLSVKALSAWPDSDTFELRETGWVKTGKVKYLESIRVGFEVIPAAFSDLLRGDNFGKLMVSV